jgi:hypothetical protein
MLVYYRVRSAFETNQALPSKKFCGYRPVLVFILFRNTHFLPEGCVARLRKSLTVLKYAALFFLLPPFEHLSLADQDVKSRCQAGALRQNLSVLNPIRVFTKISLIRFVVFA